MVLDIDVDDDIHAADHGEHPPTTIRQYLIIGVVLIVVTAVELWASYNKHILRDTLIPALLIMSLFKFVVVVALFMHLKYEKPLLNRVFAFALVLAAFILLALMTLFRHDATDAVQPAPGAAAAAAHGNPAAH